MAAAVTPSRARRMRDAAVKRKLYQSSGDNATHVSALLQMLIQKLDSLEKAVDDKLQMFVSWCMPVCWDTGVYDPLNGNYNANVWDTAVYEETSACARNQSDLPEVTSDCLLQPSVFSYNDAKNLEDSCRMCKWQPATNDVFTVEGSSIFLDLQSEAAVTIQRWWRCEFLDSAEVPSDEAFDDKYESSYANSDDDHGSDDNSAEAVAIRRAFFVSIASTNTCKEEPHGSELWSQAEILKWVSDTLNRNIDGDEPLSSIKSVWREWETANEHFPHQMRTRIVRTIDERLHGRGFPSLRELVATI